MTVVGKHEAGASLLPHPKVASGALGGAIASLAVWLIGLTGVDIPPTVAAAIATIVYAVVAYLVPGQQA